MTIPTPYVLPLPLNSEALDWFQRYRNGGCDPDVVIRHIATPADATLPVVGSVSEPAIAALLKDDGVSFISLHHKGVLQINLTRLTDAQAAIAAAGAEKARKDSGPVILAMLKKELADFERDNLGPVDMETGCAEYGNEAMDEWANDRYELIESVEALIKSLAAPDTGDAS
ncbi:hypothetical protein J2D73_19975 [Acetobacter sacchari]|uniref:Uncharacterized protein n=1 Tax=Acetobacter sacchari TaxID=2661687 RepID=A0ABS3M1N2_9PROT|nr:hypothetical protein [Acetobacter sacchari]MBO1362063.1 hypothetical protein [Acetobacter sacchari]